MIKPTNHKFRFSGEKSSARDREKEVPQTMHASEQNVDKQENRWQTKKKAIGDGNTIHLLHIIPDQAS